MYRQLVTVLVVVPVGRGDGGAAAGSDRRADRRQRRLPGGEGGEVVVESFLH